MTRNYYKCKRGFTETTTQIMTLILMSGCYDQNCSKGNTLICSTKRRGIRVKIIPLKTDVPKGTLLKSKITIGGRQKLKIRHYTLTFKMFVVNFFGDPVLAYGFKCITD